MNCGLFVKGKKKEEAKGQRNADPKLQTKCREIVRFSTFENITKFNTPVDCKSMSE